MTSAFAELQACETIMSSLARLWSYKDGHSSDLLYEVPKDCYGGNAMKSLNSTMCLSVPTLVPRKLICQRLWPD